YRTVSHYVTSSLYLLMTVTPAIPTLFPYTTLFRSYASTLVSAEATRWTDAWTTFALSEKGWAYQQDQLPSTHPVVEGSWSCWYRSEEHTSELQSVSISYAVFCLKKKIQVEIIIHSY